MEDTKKSSGKLNIYAYIKNPVRADIIRLSWPIVLELIMGTLFGMVDMIMLGRLANLGEAAASVDCCWYHEPAHVRGAFAGTGP